VKVVVLKKIRANHLMNINVIGSYFIYTERKCIVMGDKNPKKQPKPKKSVQKACASHTEVAEPELTSKKKKN